MNSRVLKSPEFFSLLLRQHCGIRLVAFLPPVALVDLSQLVEVGWLEVEWLEVGWLEG
jgi:hypothetical protein